MLEVDVITASDHLHSFANIINDIYSKFHNDLACIRAVMDQNVKKCADFAVYFYQIRWFDITAFAFKAPKMHKVVEITASAPLHSFANIINYIYSRFHNDLACIRAVMDRMRNNVAISLCISIKYDGLTLPRLLSRPLKCNK